MTINTFTAMTFMVYFLILFRGICNRFSKYVKNTVKVEFLTTFQLVDDLSHSCPQIKQIQNTKYVFPKSKFQVK